MKQRAYSIDEKNPIISIVIPAYNDENDIQECLESAIGQTISNIEIIVVDDCSIDNTVSIIQKYKDLDPRVKLIQFNENKSAFQARKTGVLSSKGKYIMFLDADDSISKNACEKLLLSIEKDPVDILHFGTNVINVGNETEENINNYRNNLNSVKQKLYGEDIFKDFVKRRYEGHLWNKIFSSKLCKKILVNTKDLVLPKAQDKYMYWMLSLNAKTYRCEPSLILYNYKYGGGVEGKKDELSIEQFVQYCTQAWTENAIDDYMSKYNSDGRYNEVIANSRNALIRHSIKNWIRLKQEDKCKGFDMMLHYWDHYMDRAKILIGIAERYWQADNIEIINSVYPSKGIEASNKKIKTIGTYYHRYDNGGIQRVLSKLMQIWIEKGYKVIFFADYDSSPNDYPLPEGVIRVKLGYPASTTSNTKRLGERLITFAEYIKKYNIDCMVYHNYLSKTLLWDSLICKIYNIPFILFYHSTFTRFLMYCDERFSSIPEMAILFDGMVVLSREDEAFWSHFSKNVKYILNPLTFELNKNRQVSQYSNNILWLGRMDDEVKQPQAAITIMKEVVKSCPEAKLIMVGDSDKEGYLDRLQERIDRLKLTKNIYLAGFHKDVEPFYKKASIFLMTSAHEGFPLALTEALSYGLPVVMFELPYLEIVKNNSGIIGVKQNDTLGASKAIIDLLNDQSKRLIMAKGSKTFLETLYLNTDIGDEWEKLFKKLEIRCDSFRNNNLDAFHLIISAYKFGIRKKNVTDGQNKILIEKITQEKQKLQDEVNKLLEKQRSSVYIETDTNNQILVAYELQKAIINQGELINKQTERFITIIENIKKENEQLILEQKKLNYIITEIRKSITYKIGRLITFVPRKIISMIK